MLTFVRGHKYRRSDVKEQAGLSRKVKGQIIRRVCETLEKKHGKPRLGNPRDPVDDLIFIMLSNRTGPEVAKSTHKILKKRFPRWEKLLSARKSTLRALIASAGLSLIKTEQIRGALARIKRTLGTLDLKKLKHLSQEEAEAFLVSLPGVSEKVAKCVMMYCLNMNVLPVDVHVYRITRRLGWHNRKRADQCHEELEALVPPAQRFAFHVDCIMHGRTTCLPRIPRCKGCCINKYCEFYRNTN